VIERINPATKKVEAGNTSDTYNVEEMIRMVSALISERIM